MALYGVSLVRKDSYFTFETLSEAKDYSIKGVPYLGVTATKTFEGKPWEIMAQNGFIYDFSLDAVRSLDAVQSRVVLNQARKYFVPNGLIIPGSFDETGNRVLSYSAWFLSSTRKFKYTEVSYV